MIISCDLHYFIAQLKLLQTMDHFCDNFLKGSPKQLNMLHLFHHLLQSLFGTSLYYTPINIGMYQYALLIPVSGGIFLRSR